MTAAEELSTLAASKSWGRARIYDSITETIGHTPLVRLNRLAETAAASGQVLLKLEFFNPLSSVKDRIGVAMIDALEARGLIERRRHPTDRRIRLLHLTDRAHPLLERMRALGDLTRSEALAGIPDPERAQLLGTLTLMKANLVEACGQATELMEASHG